MQNIFDKIEKAKVQVLDLVQPEEKTYCQQLFEKYLSHVSFINELLNNAVENYVQHKEQVPVTDEDFFHCISKMDKQITNYEEILIGLHEIVVRKIETHFQEKYNIRFNSYTGLKRPDEMNSACNLETIIENMFEQLGTDLIQSGKNQIIKNLKDQFHTTVQQPEIKNNKVSLPRYYSLGYGTTPSLEYNESKVNHLLQAIGLTLFESLTMPDLFELQLVEWKNELEYNKAYFLQSDLVVKFFKNRRIDISFPSAHTAETFWQLFQLDNIVEINNS